MDVSIVDLRPLVILGLRAAFEPAADIKIIASGNTLQSVDPDDVDVLLVGSSLVGQEPNLENLREAARITNVLIISTLGVPNYVNAYLRAGARGYIQVDRDPEEFVDAVRTVAAGGQVMPPGLNVDTLSPREQDVLACIAEGLTQEQTARRLSISKHTVDTYIRRARQKLNLGNKAQLAMAALNGQPAQLGPGASPMNPQQPFATGGCS